MLRGRAASVVPDTTCKVVSTVDGSCALATAEGLCRVFADPVSAATAARTELGSSGWSVEPVKVG